MDLQPHAHRNIDAADLASRLGTDPEPFVLDVREPDGVAAWAIPASVNIPLGQLPDRVSELPV